MNQYHMFPILSSFLLITLFAIVGVACSETEPELVDGNGNGAAAEADDEQAEDENDDENGDSSAGDGSDGDLEEAEGFSVGEMVQMGDLVMTLHAVRWDGGGEFTEPDEGMRWLVADIEIENGADSATSISSLMMFDLIDEDNRTRDLAIMADTEGSLDGELGAGRSLRGDIAWEVAEGQSNWELVFSPELFGFGQAIYDIAEEDVS